MSTLNTIERNPTYVYKCFAIGLSEYDQYQWVLIFSYNNLEFILALVVVENKNSEHNM